MHKKTSQTGAEESRLEYICTPSLRHRVLLRPHSSCKVQQHQVRPRDGPLKPVQPVVGGCAYQAILPADMGLAKAPGAVTGGLACKVCGAWGLACEVHEPWAVCIAGAERGAELQCPTGVLQKMVKGGMPEHLLRLQEGVGLAAGQAEGVEEGGVVVGRGVECKGLIDQHIHLCSSSSEPVD